MPSPFEWHHPENSVHPNIDRLRSPPQKTPPLVSHKLYRGPTKELIHTHAPHPPDTTAPPPWRRPKTHEATAAAATSSSRRSRRRPPRPPSRRPCRPAARPPRRRACGARPASSRPACTSRPSPSRAAARRPCRPRPSTGLARAAAAACRAPHRTSWRSWHWAALPATRPRSFSPRLSPRRPGGCRRPHRMVRWLPAVVWLRDRLRLREGSCPSSFGCDMGRGREGRY